MEVTPHADMLAEGFYETLKPAVEECDENVKQVLSSQQALAAELSRLHAGTNVCTKNNVSIRTRYLSFICHPLTAVSFRY